MGSTNRPVFVRQENTEFKVDGQQRIIFRILIPYNVVQREEVLAWVRDQFPNSVDPPRQTIHYSLDHELYIFADGGEATAFRLRWC